MFKIIWLHLHGSPIKAIFLPPNSFYLLDYFSIFIKLLTHVTNHTGYATERYHGTYHKLKPISPLSSHIPTITIKNGKMKARYKRAYQPYSFFLHTQRTSRICKKTHYNKGNNNSNKRFRKQKQFRNNATIIFCVLLSRRWLQ